MSRLLDTKFPPIYNAADAIFTCTVKGLDPDTSEFMPIEDIDTLTIVFTLDNANGGEEWVGTVGSGITLTGDDGEFTVWIPLATMQNLDVGSYNIGCTLSNGTITTQAIRSTIAVVDGVVG